MKRHTYEARRATKLNGWGLDFPAVIVTRTKDEVYHVFSTDEAADAYAAEINRTGRYRPEAGTGQVL